MPYCALRGRKGERREKHQVCQHAECARARARGRYPSGVNGMEGRGKFLENLLREALVRGVWGRAGARG